MPTDPREPRRDFLVRCALLAAVPALTGCGGNGRGTRPLPPPILDGPAPESGPPAAPAPVASAPPPPDLAPPRREPDVRVRLARRPADSTVELAAEGSGRQWLRVARPDERGEIGAILLVLASPVRVSAQPGGWTLVDASGTRSTLEGPAPIEIGALKGHSPAVRIDGALYPGVIRLVARGSDAASDAGPTTGSAAPPTGQGGAGIDVVNVVPLEQYLPGVVAKELYQSWKPETFRAQSVAARSYACLEIAWWRGRRHFDVVAGQASQAYVGRTDHALSNRAVRDTAGSLLVFENTVVPAYYSACCGGVSANARDAISDDPVNDLPPIRARPPMACCDWAPLWRWRSEQPSADAARRVAAWGAQRPQWRVPALTSIQSIEPTQLNAFGRPVRYRVSGNGGVVELPAEHLRMALNYAGGSAAPLGAPKTPVRSGHFAATVRGGSAQLAGQGFGHGVGMCQFGAEGMARKGVAWSRILEIYYPGARVLRTYG